MINCWRVFGDPLYAINGHDDVHRTLEAPESRDTDTRRNTSAPIS